MSYLETDKQTLADLSIVESMYDEHPLYSLYPATETKKGKRLMLHWITYPLNDISAIRKRQEAIAWQKLPELPLDEEELDFIEYYLEYRDQIRKPNILISLTSAFDRLLKHDAKRYVIKRGVTLIIRLLNQLELIRTNLPEDAPSLLKENGTKHSIYHLYQRVERSNQTLQRQQNTSLHLYTWQIRLFIPLHTLGTDQRTAFTYLYIGRMP